MTIFKHIFWLYIFVFQIENRCVIKSGTEFRQFSHITMRLGVMHDDKPRVDVQLVDVTSDFEEDEALKLSLDKFTSKNFLFIVPIVIPTIWMILKMNIKDALIRSDHYKWDEAPLLSQLLIRIP